MARVKRSVAGRARRKKILKMASGFRGARGRLFRAAKDAVHRSLQYAYAHRREKKGDFRRLWTARINAASRAEGMRYSVFANALKRANVKLNRKVLSQIAVHYPDIFEKITTVAKSQTN
jgi:large subunit ribosomal protein L20